jgi:hypothetical protein
MSGRMAEVRAQLGDREIGAPGGKGVMLQDSRWVAPPRAEHDPVAQGCAAAL